MSEFIEVFISKDITTKAINNVFLEPSLPGEFFVSKLRRFLYIGIKELLLANNIPVIDTYVSNLKTKSAEQNTIHNIPGYKIREYGFEYYGIKEYNMDFCLSQYAANSKYPAYYHELQAYPQYKKSHDKCLGNLSFVLKKGFYKKIHFSFEDPFNAVGFINDVNIKKQKPFVAIIGIFIDIAFLTSVGDSYQTICNCPNSLIVENIENHTTLFPIFQCQCCGKLYVCSCSHDYVKSLTHKAFKISAYGESPYSPNLFYRECICQLCQARTYPAKLPQSYYDMIEFYFPALNTNLKVKNYLRERYNKKPLATGYKGESLLYEVIIGIIGKENVLVHHRPDWLNGLEIDIYVPSLKIGFEYQGKQHYEPIKIFGGKNALEKLKLRDEEKKRICKLNNVKLYEFRYDQEIYPDEILKILQET